MRDRLAEIEHKFRNRFPSNPTQTVYNRFFRTPKAEIKTPFTESVNKFNKTKKYTDRDRLKTAYSRFLE